MSIVTGRTGADAINKYLKKQQHTLSRYAAKMDIAISLAQAAGIISAAEASAIRAYIAALQAAAVALQKLADYVGF